MIVWNWFQIERLTNNNKKCRLKKWKLQETAKIFKEMRNHDKISLDEGQQVTLFTKAVPSTGSQIDLKDIELRDVKEFQKSGRRTQELWSIHCSRREANLTNLVSAHVREENLWKGKWETNEEHSH